MDMISYKAFCIFTQNTYTQKTQPMHPFFTPTQLAVERFTHTLVCTNFF